MKLEVGKLYRTKDAETIKIIDRRSVHEDEPTNYFLGIVEHGLPQTYWYTESGRLYNSGISPKDLEREVPSKIEFRTKIRVIDGKLIAKWPKELTSDFAEHNVKITVERI